MAPKTTRQAKKTKSRAITLKGKVSVLVPCYNEAETIKIILDKLIKLPFVFEIIVVDDCSQDKSAQIIKSLKSKKIKYYKMARNSGKTAAIQKGVELAQGDIMVVQDADLEYDPVELADVVAPIQQDVADVVYGSRFLVKKASRVLYFYHFLANKFLTFLSNCLTNMNMTDIETCYKAFRKEILKDFRFTSKGFGMEVELTAIVSKLPVRVYETPISYYGRTYEEGKKIGLSDGLHAIWYILYYNIIAPHLPARKKYLAKVKALLQK